MGAAERIDDVIEMRDGASMFVGAVSAVSSVSNAKLTAVHRELGRACSGNAVLTERGAVALARYHSKQRAPRAWGRRS